MCSDQANSYSNFNSWVKSLSPDVCVWAEAAKLYNNDGSKRDNDWWTGERTIPSFSYGHSSTYTHYKKTDYPNMITLAPSCSFISKKDIEFEHHYAVTKIKYGGIEVNLVAVHLPKTTSDTEHDGLADIKKLLAATIEKSADNKNEYWMIVGDFNAICRRDNDLPGSPYKSWSNDPVTGKPKELSFAVIDYVLGHEAGFHDCMADKHPGQFVSSRYYDARIDYVFCNQKLYDRIQSIEVPEVTFGDGYRKTVMNNTYYSPSDHKPIMIKFFM